MKRRTIIVLIAITSLLIIVFGKEFLNRSGNAEPIAEVLQSSEHQHEGNSNHHATEGIQQAELPFYQGEVVSFEHGGAYTYIEVKEKTNMTFWIAVEQVDVKTGHIIQFQKELVMHDFKSKALNKTFDEIMFASNLQYRVSDK